MYKRERKRRRRRRNPDLVRRFKRRTGLQEDDFPPQFSPRLRTPRPGSGTGNNT